MSWCEMQMRNCVNCSIKLAMQLPLQMQLHLPNSMPGAEQMKNIKCRYNRVKDQLSRTGLLLGDKSCSGQFQSLITARFRQFNCPERDLC